MYCEAVSMMLTNVPQVDASDCLVELFRKKISCECLTASLWIEISKSEQCKKLQNVLVYESKTCVSVALSSGIEFALFPTGLHLSLFVFPLSLLSFVCL